MALVIACVPQIAYVALIRYREWQWISFALVIIASCGWALSVRGLRAQPTALPLRQIVAVIAAVGVCMVVFPARGSNDVFSYAMYGRVLSEHDANPYTALPDQFRNDPIFTSVGQRWVHTPSRYGPIFTAVSAIGTAVLPGERLALRLYFQVITALAVLLLLVLAWRRWHSTAALVFVGLHPLMMMSVVNGAHNDIFVGLGVFGFVLLLERRRMAWAGVALAGAALVKVSALLAAVAAALWLLTRRRTRDAFVMFAVAGGVTAVGMAATPGCVAAVRAAADLNRNASIWYPVLLFSTRGNSFPVHGPMREIAEVEQFVKTPALVAMALGLAVAVWALRRRDEASLWSVAALGICTFSVFAAWVMPWYLIWAIPLIAMTTGRARTTMAVHASALLAIAQLHGFATTNLNLQSWLLLVIVPWAFVAAYGWAIWSDARVGGAEPESVSQPRGTVFSSGA